MVIARFKPAIIARGKAQHPQYQIGAVIYYKSQVVSSGYNVLHKTHPLCDFHTYGRPVTIHAEAMAIAKAKTFINNLTASQKKKLSIYIYREHKNGQPALAAPCDGCRNLLIEVGIAQINFTTETGFQGQRYSIYGSVT